MDLLRLPLALSSKSIGHRKSQLSTVWERGGGGSGVGRAWKNRPPPAPNMDNDSTYSGYSYKSSHSRSTRKHRLVGQRCNIQNTIGSYGINGKSIFQGEEGQVSSKKPWRLNPRRKTRKYPGPPRVAAGWGVNQRRRQGGSGWCLFNHLLA